MLMLSDGASQDARQARGAYEKLGEGAEDMQDMKELLAHYRGMLEPEGAGGDAPYDREAHVKRYSDDSHVFFPGNFLMAGHHTGRFEVDKAWVGARLLWPNRSRLFRTHFFLGEDTIGIEWWSRNEVWNGSAAKNSGVARLRFRDGQIIDHYEITDTEYFEEIHGDWRGHVGPELGRHLPTWSRTRDKPVFPRPGEHEWAIDYCTTDGREQAEPEGRANIARVEALIRALPRIDESLLAEGVDVFFQGREWPLGGHHRGREAVRRVVDVARGVWPEAQLVRAGFWASETHVLVAWFVDAETWTGAPVREGGFTVFDWRDGRISGIRTYLDTLYQGETTEGWREYVGADTCAALPNGPRPERPLYPETERHE